jgi:hypothetical protein
MRRSNRSRTSSTATNPTHKNGTTLPHNTPAAINVDGSLTITIATRPATTTTRHIVASALALSREEIPIPNVTLFDPDTLVSNDGEEEVFDLDRHHKKQEGIEKRIRIREEELLNYHQYHNPVVGGTGADKAGLYGKMGDGEIEIIWHGSEVKCTKREPGPVVIGDYVHIPGGKVLEEMARMKLCRQKSHRRSDQSLLKLRDPVMDESIRSHKKMDPRLLRRNTEDRATRNRSASSNSTNRRSQRTSRSKTTDVIVEVMEKKERASPRRRGSPSPPKRVEEEISPETLIINTATKTISSRGAAKMVYLMDEDEDQVDFESLREDIPVESRYTRMEKRRVSENVKEVCDVVEFGGLLEFSRGYIGEVELSTVGFERSDEWKRFYKNWRRNLTRKKVKV